MLSDDALLIIFGLLSPRDLLRTTAVCSRWRAVAQADILWRPLVWRTFGRRPEADLRLQASAAPYDDHAVATSTSTPTSWLALYRGLVAQALPVQAVLNGKTILVLGDVGVGKTAYAERCLAGAQESTTKKKKGRFDMVALRGTGKHHLTLPTNYGPVNITLWDQPATSREISGGVRDELLAGGQAAIIMFDIASLQSYRHVGLCHRAMMRVRQDAPMVLVGSKLDGHHHRRLQRKYVMFHRRMGMDYHEICAPANHNWAKPLESLFHKFTGKDVRIRMEEVTLQEPQIGLGPEFFAAIEQDTAAAASRVPPAISAAFQAFLYAEGRA